MLAIFDCDIQRKQRKNGDDYMITAQLGDRTFEFESEFVVDIHDLRVFRYCDLWRCSKDALVRLLGTLTEEIEMGGPWIGLINVY